MTEPEFQKIKREHDEAQEELSEAKGALKSLKDRLLEEFGLRTAAEARVRLKELEKQKAALDREVERLSREYQKEFPR